MHITPYTHHTLHILHIHITPHTQTPPTHTHTNHMKERRSAFEQKARHLNGRGTGMAHVEKCALYIRHESRKDTVWAENRKKQGMGKESGERTRA